MSTTDKTRQQLVDSMRKTKASAAGKTAGKQAAKKKVARPVGRAAKKAPASTARKQPARIKAQSVQEPLDSYQAGRRVWPD